jgi:putative flippase GtrA
VEGLWGLAQARLWIGFILNDFWSFCAMRTDCRMSFRNKLLLSEAADGARTR